MKKANVLLLLAVLLVGIVLIVVMRPPEGSPYHPFVGTWELERGENDSFQRIVLTPSRRVIINGNVQGEFSFSPAVITINIDNRVLTQSIEVQRDRMYLYQSDTIVSTYKRINYCWPPSPSVCR